MNKYCFQDRNCKSTSWLEHFVDKLSQARHNRRKRSSFKKKQKRLMLGTCFDLNIISCGGCKGKRTLQKNLRVRSVRCIWKRWQACALILQGKMELDLFFTITIENPSRTTLVKQKMLYRIPHTTRLLQFQNPLYLSKIKAPMISAFKFGFCFLDWSQLLLLP